MKSGSAASNERPPERVPQIRRLPPDVASLDVATDTIDLANSYRICGKNADSPLAPWQEDALKDTLGTRSDGSWAASTVATFIPRQQGKTDIIHARELAGLVILGEKLILHTAHQVPTAVESFRRMCNIFEANPDLSKMVQRIRYGSGEQAIEMKSGARILYKSRTNSSGRGYAGVDLTVYDEAQDLRDEQIAASAPTKLAEPNAQSWYAGSGGLATSSVAWRMRKNAFVPTAGRFAYVEYTAQEVRVREDGSVSFVTPTDPLDEGMWFRAMPSLGLHVSEEAVRSLLFELGPEKFAREGLNIWDPEIGGEVGAWPAETWQAVNGSGHEPSAPFFVAVDATPFEYGRPQFCALAACGGGVVEVLEPRPSMGTLAADVLAVAGRFGAPVVLDPTGPASFLKPALEAAGVAVVEVSGQRMGQACALFYDDVSAGRVRVRRNPDLDRAVSGAQVYPKGDAWVWARRHASADVSPLVAVTLAWWAAAQAVPSDEYDGSFIDLDDL